MADAQEQTDTEVSQETTETATTEVGTDLTKLQAELQAKNELIKTLRKYEKSQKDSTEQALIEQNKFKELFEAEKDKTISLTKQIIDSKLDTAIASVISESGTRSKDTVAKLIDRTQVIINEDGTIDTKSIIAQIKSLQKTDPVLFELPDVNSPSLRKVAEDTSTLTYETEIRKATSQKQLEAIAVKYGKI